MADRLFIGTRRYSSWSLRGWLLVRLAGLGVEEVVIALEEGGTAGIRAVSPSGQVPYLEHDGNQVWDSLAIAEYCAELAPALWPEGRVARTRARVLSAEMHAGFRALRVALPMNLGRDRPLAGAIPDAVQAEIDRIVSLWTETRARFGADGPFLFGAAFGAADAMYAPVVARLAFYQVALPAVAASYRDAVLSHPLMREWSALAAAEPTDWLLAHYEDVP